MQRITLTGPGGPEYLILEEAAPLTAGPGELLVDVEAAGINYFDVYQRNGQIPLQTPGMLGLEGVGRVRQVGDGEVDGFRPDDRVAWIDVFGSYASEAVVPARRAVRVPEGMAPHQALLFQPLTAQYLATGYRAISPGDRVLVHAAAGGVGQLLVQWFKHLGAWVAGTVSSEAKAAVVRDLGANAVIVYGESYDFRDEIRSLTGGKGVHLVIDGIGAGTFDASIEALAPCGTVVSIGSASGPVPDVRVGRLTQRGLRVAGGSVFSHVADREDLRRRAAEVFDGIAAGWLRPAVGATFPLAEAADAHRALETRKTTGKLYLAPGEDTKGQDDADA